MQVPGCSMIIGVQKSIYILQKHLRFKTHMSNKFDKFDKINATTLRASQLFFS